MDVDPLKAIKSAIMPSNDRKGKLDQIAVWSSAVQLHVSGEKMSSDQAYSAYGYQSHKQGTRDKEMASMFGVGMAKAPDARGLTGLQHPLGNFPGNRTVMMSICSWSSFA